MAAVSLGYSYHHKNIANYIPRDPLAVFILAGATVSFWKFIQEIGKFVREKLEDKRYRRYLEEFTDALEIARSLIWYLSIMSRVTAFVKFCELAKMESEQYRHIKKIYESEREGYLTLRKCIMEAADIFEKYTVDYARVLTTNVRQVLYEYYMLEKNDKRKWRDIKGHLSWILEGLEDKKYEKPNEYRRLVELYDRIAQKFPQICKDLDEKSKVVALAYLTYLLSPIRPINNSDLSIYSE